MDPMHEGQRPAIPGAIPGALALALALVSATLADAERLPSPASDDPIQKLALDGDGDRLVLFYCAESLSLPGQNPGVVLEWTGSSWATLHNNVTSQCSDPDVVLGEGEGEEEAEVAGLFLDDSDDLGVFCLGGACTGGGGVNQDGLRRVRVPRIGWAFGFPYATYMQLQGGLARQRIWLDPLYPGIDPFADPPQTTGAFHCESGSCYDPLDRSTIAGTDEIVFAAYELPPYGCVAVRYETETAFGTYRCITQFGGPATQPEVAVVVGVPVVFWIEPDGATSTVQGAGYIGELTPPGGDGNVLNWFTIEDWPSTGAVWDRIRVVVANEVLYTLYRRGSELSVRRWEGFTDWTPIWSETVSPYPTTPDIGVRGNAVFVAWVSGDEIAVEAIDLPEPLGAPAALAVAAALTGLRWRTMQP